MNYIYYSFLTKRSFFLILLCTFLTFSISAQLPSGFVDSKIQGGYTTPTGLVFSKNGQKMFVWEKSGKVWCSTWNGITYVKQSTPALDISEEVGNWRDLGLVSMVLDPNFDSNALIYLFYQVDRHHLYFFGTPQYSATADEYFKPTISRLTRYRLSTSNGVTTADITTRKILLGETFNTGVPETFESHAGGKMVFGTDGTLFVSTGDNASFVSKDMGSASESYWQQAVADGIIRPTENVGAFRAQLVNSFCGKLLRLDPNTGDGLPSNPFYDAPTPRSAKSRAWAMGFRNPFRISLKTGTGSTNPSAGNPGTIIVGDVQDGDWEEINIIDKAGLNCGWPLFEGIKPYYIFFDSGKLNPEHAGTPTFKSLCAFGGRGNINSPNAFERRYYHTAPALDWQHGNNVARYVDYTTGNTEDAKVIGAPGSLTAGTPFGGSCVIGGPFYTGTTFPAPYRNVYFFADYVDNWIKAAVLIDNVDHKVQRVIDFAPAGYGKGIVDLAYCPRDESIFYININTGDIQRISYGSNVNRPPVAVIGSDKTSGASPLTVNFSSNGSNDPDGNAITYSWDFGDGTSSTSANPSHTFTSTGSKGFTVRLTVKDIQGLTDSKTLAISTNNTAPSVKITNPINNSNYTLAVESAVTLRSTVTDNDVTGMQYAWQVSLRHNTHEHREPINTLQTPTVLIAPVGCDGDAYHFLIELKVTDNGGLSARDSVKIFPDCSSTNLNIKNLQATAQSSSVALTWTNPTTSFDEVMIVAKANAGFTTRPSGTNYASNSNFTGNGSAFEGGKVMLRGTETNKVITGLTTNTRYYFRIFTRKGTSWSGGVEVSAVPTTTSSTFSDTKCYHFTARNSGLVLETPDNLISNSIPLEQSVNFALKRQTWRIKNQNDGTFRIINGNSGKSWDVQGAKTTDGATINQHEWHGLDNQRWIFTKNAEGYYQVKAKNSGKVATIENNSSSAKARLIQMTGNNSTSQQFKVDEVVCPAGVVAMQSANILAANGYRDAKKSVITWVSNANSKSDYFVVQKLNANEPFFEKLETVNAKLGTPTDQQTYSVVDDTPIHGENYYRVALYRVGEYLPQYSEVIMLDFSHLHDYMLFPNPSDDYVDVDLEVARYRSVDILVIDATGKVVKQQKIDSAPIGPVRISLVGLDAGQYFIRIEAEGKREVVKKLMIAR